MRYAAVLQSAFIADLTRYEKCFTSDPCRISKLGELWVLESSRFNACSDPKEVLPLANATLSVVRRILSLYSGLGCTLTVGDILCIDAGGKVCGKMMHATSATIVITSPTAMQEMTTPIHGQPLASAMFECAQKDAKVSEALKLFQDIENRWSDVYDIIEFLGGPDQIAQSGLGTRNEARIIKRTATYYRHLGRPTPSLLPSNPPTVAEASLFAKRALRRWIESRL